MALQREVLCCWAYRRVAPSCLEVYEQRHKSFGHVGGGYMGWSFYGLWVWRVGDYVSGLSGLGPCGRRPHIFQYARGQDGIWEEHNLK